MNTQKVSLLSFLIIVSFFTAYAKGSDGFFSELMSDTPSESDGMSEFVKSFNSQLIVSGAIKILSFNKINGMKKMIDGVPSYEMQYEASYQFPGGFNPQCSPEKKKADHKRRLANSTWFIGGDPKCRNVEYRKIGEIVDYSGKLIFSLTDNGWQAKDGIVY